MNERIETKVTLTDMRTGEETETSLFLPKGRTPTAGALYHLCKAHGLDPQVTTFKMAPQPTAKERAEAEAFRHQSEAMRRALAS